MNILGIESSCDETAAAVVQDGRRLLSNVVVSQIDIHREYGGVVPEIAARSHLEAINPVINNALAQSGCTWDDIDAIAVTYAPGLSGSLLVGTLTARTLALLHHKPLYPVHHVEAHVYANFIVEQAAPPATDKWVARGGAAPAFEEISEGDFSKEGADRVTGPASSDLRADFAGKISDDGSGVKKLHLPAKQPAFPLLALIVSGGHSQLVLFRDHGDYQLIGQTQDDAVGEAFDKVAKILGLPYPGGPSIATAAEHGDPTKYAFPKAKLANPYDFSFSGLKTAVLRAVQRDVGKDFTFPSHALSELLSDAQRHDFAASFQRVAVETLIDKTEAAYREYQPASVVLAGGVAANTELRHQLAERLPLPLEYAPIQLCTDNAAMIATLGYYQAQHTKPIDPHELKTVSSLSMQHTAWRPPLS